MTVEMAKTPNEGFSLFCPFIGIILTMNYHDFIWDLGGTLLDNYETSTNAFVATLKDFHIQADHDSVYAALKNLNTGCNSNLCPSYFKFSYGIQEKEALGLQEPVLFEGAKELLERDPSTWRTPWYLIGIAKF